jgi:hypothetical protein
MEIIQARVQWQGLVLAVLNFPSFLNRELVLIYMADFMITILGLPNKMC